MKNYLNIDEKINVIGIEIGLPASNLIIWASQNIQYRTLIGVQRKLLSKFLNWGYTGISSITGIKQNVQWNIQTLDVIDKQTWNTQIENYDTGTPPYR